jgi:hypothetical protein
MHLNVQRGGSHQEWTILTGKVKLPLLSIQTLKKEQQAVLSATKGLGVVEKEDVL